MRERMKSGKRQKPRINIRKSFESYWFRLFEGELKDFAVIFRAELSDIVMETDADMCSTVKGWNFRNKHKGGHTSCPMRWLGLTKKTSRCETAESWICGTG